MVEQIGSGIVRIKNAMHESGLPEPVFKTEGMFTDVLQRHYTGDPSIALEQESEIYREKTAETREKTAETREKIVEKPIEKTSETREKIVEKPIEKIAETREKTVEKIIRLIQENPFITSKQLQIETGLKRRGIEYNLQKLQKAGIINRQGPDKGGFWIILKNS